MDLKKKSILYKMCAFLMIYVPVVILGGGGGCGFGIGEPKLPTKFVTKKDCIAK